MANRTDVGGQDWNLSLPQWAMCRTLDKDELCKEECSSSASGLLLGLGALCMAVGWQFLECERLQSSLTYARLRHWGAVSPPKKEEARSARALHCREGWMELGGL